MGDGVLHFSQWVKSRLSLSSVLKAMDVQATRYHGCTKTDLSTWRSESDATTLTTVLLTAVFSEMIAEYG